MAVEGEAVARPALPRVSTGIPGLDDVLNGGLVAGALYLVTGPPGAGKTTLANQVAFARAAAGDATVYGTVLVEPHARMLANLAGYRFFDPAQVARRVHYVSLFDELDANGLPGALALLRRLVREQRASVLVIDGAGLVADFAAGPLELRRFAAELHAQVSALDCTTLLLSDLASADPSGIGPHVDGAIVFEDASVGLRDLRLLRVVKLRGVGYLRGRHHYEISEDGIEVFPRLEATLPGRTPQPGAGEPRTCHPFGVAGLDELLGGGLPSGSSTLLMGVAGAGKTVTGLHFVVEGARRGEAGMIAGFQETPDQLVATAASLGLDLGDHVAAGRVRLLWYPPGELLPDAWARHLLAVVDEHRPRRLFADALGDLPRRVPFPDRLPLFLSALTGALRERNVASLFAAELRSFVGTELEVPPSGFPADVDNVILLRYVELRSRLRRLVSIVKRRDGPYDTSIHEFAITSRGMQVAATFESAEAVLTGVARLHAPGDEAPVGGGTVEAVGGKPA